MRILNIVGAFPPAFVHGGPVYTTYHLSKSLIELGHEVFVLSTDINGEERLDVPSVDTSWEQVPVRYCHWQRGPIPYHSPELGEEVRRRASDFDIALISSSWTGYGVVAGRECRKAGLPYVMYAHGCYAPLRLHKSYWKKRFWWRVFDKKLYNKASTVVALTHAEIDEIRAMGVKSPIVQIPNGVDLNELSIGLTRSQLEDRFPILCRKRMVLFLGRFDPVKGIDLLISAFKHIANRQPDIVLVLAGPDERGYLAKMQEMVASHNLSESVLFPGMITGVAKVGLLTNAELFVLTSRGEGMSIATLEAMACSTPVLITRACNFPEVATYHAGTIIDYDEEQLILALDQMLDPSYRQTLRLMGENARDLVFKQFSWEHVAEQTADMCEKIVQSA